MTRTKSSLFPQAEGDLDVNALLFLRLIQPCDEADRRNIMTTSVDGKVNNEWTPTLGLIQVKSLVCR